MTRSLATSTLLAACLLGCGQQVRESESTEVVEISGDIVSRVGGSAIAVDEVERLARVGGMPPSSALSRLQAERLLGHEARERGYGARSRTEQVAREALVQELLVAAVEPVKVQNQEIEAAYQAEKARFVQPERRRATHVLVSPTTGVGSHAAEKLAQHTLRALQSSLDWDATLALAQSESSSELNVVVQDLPLTADDGTFVAEFSRALFSVSEPGVVPEVVKTQFGYHAILVREIVPSFSEPLPNAFETLRREIATRKQTERLEELLSDLRQRTRVKFSPDALKILATLDF